MSIMRVIGASRHQGEFNGAKYNYTKVYAIARMDGSDGKKAGYAGLEIRALPEVYQQVMDLPFTPEGVECDVTIEQVPTGRGEFRDTVSLVKPIKPAASVIPNKAA